MLIRKVIKVKAMATVSGNIAGLKRVLTIIPKDYNGASKEPLVLYKENSDGTLDIPRGLVEASKLEVDGKWVEVNWNNKITLYPNQEKIISQFNKHSTRYGGIIQAHTGSGKTVIGLYIANQFKGYTLIIVPLDSLVKQWKERILQFTDIKEDEIGLIRGDITPTPKHKIVIGMLHSLAQRKYFDELYDRFKLVIFDEGHTLGAKTFSKVAGQFNCKYRLMLSATPRRKDGTENVFLWHIGKIVALSSQGEMTPTVYIAPYRGGETRETRYTTPYGKFLYSRYLNILAKSNERNNFIVSLIEKAYKKDRNILVLTDRLQQIALLKQLLEQAGIKEVSLITGNLKETYKQVILATYGSAGMGVDIPKLDTLIFATPRVDIEQAVGRLLRTYKNKRNPLVIDIVDVLSKTMLGYSQARRRIYRKSNFIVKGGEYE